MDEKKIENELMRGVPQRILDCMYIAMIDAHDTLEGIGVANLRRCLNYLENEHQYEPPAVREALGEKNESM